MKQNYYFMYAIIFLIILLGYFLINKKSSSISLIEGDIYSVNSGDGNFSIVKILVIDSNTVHVKIYKNKFKERPTKINISELSLGTINDQDGFGMEHLPLAKQEFLSWQPSYLSREQVSEDELEGYKIWKDANGGVWGE